MPGDEYGLPGLVPRPDPTALTNAAVTQAKDELRRELDAQVKILEARMAAMDAERHLMLQIMDERKAEIQRRFSERDTRYDERDTARQEAVRTALSAARELNDARDAATEQASQKFEQAVREQIAQSGALFTAGRERLDAKIEALKERIDRGEGGTAGATEYRTERRLDFGSNLTAVSVLIGALILAVTLYAALHH